MPCIKLRPLLSFLQNSVDSPDKRKAGLKWKYYSSVAVERRGVRKMNSHQRERATVPELYWKWCEEDEESLPIPPLINAPTSALHYRLCSIAGLVQNMADKKLDMGSPLMLTTLPRELIAEILVKVSEGSFRDFTNLKFCCTYLKEIAEEPRTVQRISFGGLGWSHGFNELTPFAEGNNPEALYRKGLIRIFGHEPQFDEAVGYLQSALHGGHMLSCYVLAMCYLFKAGLADNAVSLGIDLLRRVCLAGIQVDCRWDLFYQVVFPGDFVHDGGLQPAKPDDICRQKHSIDRVDWSFEFNYFSHPNCIDCRMDAEIHMFYIHWDWGRNPL